MSSQNPTVDSDDRPSIEKSEPCESCDGSGMLGDGRNARWCEECINIPEGATPDNPPENPYEQLDELREEQAQIEEREEQNKEVVEKLNEARSLIGEAADIDVVNDETAAVLNHLSSRVKDQTHPFRQQAHQQIPEGRIYQLQEYINLLESRQGMTREDANNE